MNFCVTLKFLIHYFTVVLWIPKFVPSLQEYADKIYVADLFLKVVGIIYY